MSAGEDVVVPILVVVVVEPFVAAVVVGDSLLKVVVVVESVETVAEVGDSSVLVVDVPEDWVSWDLARELLTLGLPVVLDESEGTVPVDEP